MQVFYLPLQDQTQVPGTNFVTSILVKSTKKFAVF